MCLPFHKTLFIFTQGSNMNIPTPEDFKNMKPGPNQDFHSSYMAQTSNGGKVITTIQRNDNGKQKEYTITN